MTGFSSLPGSTDWNENRPLEIDEGHRGCFLHELGLNSSCFCGQYGQKYRNFLRKIRIEGRHHY